MAKPCETHWKVAKHVLIYLKGIVDYGLLYTDVSNVQLEGYFDSNWAGNLDDKKSTFGYAFNIGSGVISWSSKKQPTVSLSSTEAEYKALTSTTCETIWLRRILEYVGTQQKKATRIQCDKSKLN